MTCYLLFKEPMKSLVPRGSGRHDKLLAKVTKIGFFEFLLSKFEINTTCPHVLQFC